MLSFGEDMKQMLTLKHLKWKSEIVQHFEKPFGSLLKRLNIHLPYDPDIPFLGNFPRK